MYILNKKWYCRRSLVGVINIRYFNNYLYSIAEFYFFAANGWHSFHCEPKQQWMKSLLSFCYIYLLTESCSNKLLPATITRFQVSFLKLNVTVLYYYFLINRLTKEVSCCASGRFCVGYWKEKSRNMNTTN